MAAKVAINGFGRIGRNFFRAAVNGQNFEIVAINDLTDAATLAHLLKYDSVRGTFPFDVQADGDTRILVNGRPIEILREKSPRNLPWDKLQIDFTVEATGCYTRREDAAQHLEAGAKNVLISAPGQNADITICMGINESLYDPAAHKVVSNASCTTNCLAPVAKVLLEEFGIIRGMMTTVHSYTNGQRILDLPHKDLRRGRAAGLSMIPTTTGAAKAVTTVMPELEGKLYGMAVRVPTPNVSLIDLVVETEKPTTEEQINEAMQKAATGPLKGILDYCDLPLVSTDFNGCPASCTFDALSTTVMDGTMVKTISWYDNEWGYSNRLCDLLNYMTEKM